MTGPNQADICFPRSSPAPIDILWEIRQQKPDLFNKMEIYVDGGVKHGTDVVRILCSDSINCH
jgi:isopentenyl diphosphate isomerase/L-lactate dehydrogenase-like FMN-dependent dehydrogenase